MIETVHLVSLNWSGCGIRTGMPSTTGYSTLQALHRKLESSAFWTSSPLQVGQASICRKSGGSIVFRYKNVIWQYAINFIAFEANYSRSYCNYSSLLLTML
jgi:hypothetical protein